MLNWQCFKDWQAVICHLLIFYSTTYQDVFIAIAPIVGNTIHKTVYALGEEIEPKVTSLLYHLPALLAPLIRIFKQEIRCKAGKNYLAALYLP